jgi:hypothetical protein
MLRPVNSNQMQLFQTTVPDSVAQSLNSGDILLLVDTEPFTLHFSFVRFVHSKFPSNMFKLSSLANPYSEELPLHRSFPPSTAAIPLPPSDIVYLVQRRSSTDAAAVFTSNSTLAYDVGDPVVFMGEVFGHVDVETIYYIRSRTGSNSFTLSLSNGGFEILVPSNLSWPMSGVMAIFSAYSTVITHNSGNTTVAASPTLIAIGDMVQISGAGSVPSGIYYVQSKPTSRSFVLTVNSTDTTPILLNQLFDAMIMSKFVERKCSPVSSGSESRFECSFPAFNDKNFEVIPGRFYPALVATSVSNYATAVRWTA